MSNLYTYITLMLLVFCTTINAQKLTVESFTLAEMDLTAQTSARQDNNGINCALVKVGFGQQGCVFEGGVKGDVENKTGEYWVYMPKGNRFLKIKHPSYSPLMVTFADYGIEKLESNRTYILTITSANAVQETQKQQLTIKYSPANAVVLVDNNPVDASKGIAKLEVTVGQHSYLVAANGYYPDNATFTVRADTPKNINVELNKKTSQPAVASNQVSSQVRYQTATSQVSQSVSPQVVSTSTNSAITNSSVSTTASAVDLGLSVKWAICNLGATKPEEYGDYYAWGETSTKSNYEWSTYFDTSDGGETFNKYNTSNLIGGKTILAPEDDVAHVQLGGNWRMPTIEEYDELIDKCKWKWTKQNGVKGYKVTSKTNGNSIFLPAAGASDIRNIEGPWGYYWLSSLSSYSSSAWYMAFYKRYVSRYYFSKRCSGLSIRPVCP